MTHRFFLFALCLFLLSTAATAQQVESSGTQENILQQRISREKALGHAFPVWRLFSAPQSRPENQYGHSQRLMFDFRQHLNLLQGRPGTLALTVPLYNGDTLALELYQIDPFGGGAGLFFMDNSGEHPATPSGALFYRGVILGNTQSVATLAVTEDGIQAMFLDGDASYNLGPLEGQRSEYVLYNDRDLRLPLPFTCGVSDDAVRIPESEPESAAAYGFPLCVPLNIHCDFDLYKKQGSSVAKSINYVTALFNQVAAVYDVEAINLAIDRITVWSVNDPFSPVGSNGVASSGVALDKFGSLMSLLAPAGRFSCLLAADAGTLGGIAWLDQVCAGYQSNGAGPCNYSDVNGTNPVNFPTYSWDTNVWAHELGHNLGSPHTHWCGWSGGAIDNCATPEGNCNPGPAPVNGGTIMSYCHLTSSGINLNRGFGPLPGARIRSRIYQGICLPACTEECFENISVGDLAANDIRHFQATASIAGFGVIPAGTTTNIRFNAGEFAVLKPGFQAVRGAAFRAYIQGCNGAVAPPEIVAGRYADSAPRQVLDLEAMPNPFTTQVTLSYTLIEDAQVEIRIYNGLGQLVCQPLSAQFQLAGTHRFDFYPENLPTGLYTAVILYDGRKASRQIALTR